MYLHATTILKRNQNKTRLTRQSLVWLAGRWSLHRCPSCSLTDGCLTALPCSPSHHCSLRLPWCSCESSSWGEGSAACRRSWTGRRGTRLWSGGRRILCAGREKWGRGGWVGNREEAERERGNGHECYSLCIYHNSTFYIKRVTQLVMQESCNNTFSHAMDKPGYCCVCRVMCKVNYNTNVNSNTSVLGLPPPPGTRARASLPKPVCSRSNNVQLMYNWNTLLTQWVWSTKTKTWLKNFHYVYCLWMPILSRDIHTHIDSQGRKNSH